VNFNYYGVKKWSQDRYGPPVSETEWTANKNISSLLTLPKKTTNSQPFHKLNPGQSIYWVRGFFKAQIAPNIDTLSAFGCVRAGGFEAYEN